MANPEHVAILMQGMKVWNEWREEHPDIIPNLVKADITWADLNNAHHVLESLTGANLSRANLSRANLAGTYLLMANLNDANLYEADLTRAQLNGATISSADLTGTHLNEADITYADLNHANLYEADLTQADLTGTFLRRASFRNALLEGTNFSWAIMESTVLGAVDLSTAIGLDIIHHWGPSTIGIDTLYLSKGKIPEIFLREAGVSDEIIALQSTLRGKPIDFYSVFISYSHADKSFARRLYDGLQGRGIRCWLDEHQILPGQKIHVEVDRGIRIWDKVLLCCSGHSLTSWWVNNEIELTIQKEQSLWKERGEEVLALIPLNLDGYMFKPEWHSGWKGQIMERLAADFTGWEQDNAKFEQQFERVVRALRAGDGGREGPPKPKL